MPTIAKDTPLAEITLRKYEPPSAKGRELVRKFCLSLGLLQPGDSRDIVVDVLHVLLTHKGKALSSKEVEQLAGESRKSHGLPPAGLAPSNIRRQLLRLQSLFLVEKRENTYRIREGLPLSKILEEHLIRYYLKSILDRLHDYAEALDSVRAEGGAKVRIPAPQGAAEGNL